MPQCVIINELKSLLFTISWYNVIWPPDYRREVVCLLVNYFAIQTSPIG